MILYHGSNTEVSHIDLSKCTKYKDFGQGFYLTSIKQQACERAKKVTRRFNSAHAGHSGMPTLNIYEFDEKALAEKLLADDINMIAFLEPNEKWATFVINNRNRDFSDHGNILSNHDNKYDIVHGLVANDDISAILDAFLIGILPMPEIPNALIFKQLNDQYSFHTPAAVSYLKFIWSEKL